MDQVYEHFLNVLRCAVKDRALDEESSIEGSEFSRILNLARSHQVLPLIAETVYRLDSLSDKQRTLLLRMAKKQVIVQATRTAEFIDLYQEMNACGLHPSLMKGIVLRNLYPHPEHRASLDEDLLIHPDEILKYDAFMLSQGLHRVDPNADIRSAYEVSYEDKGRYLYIEIHKSPIAPDSTAYGECAALFEQAYGRSISVCFNGVELKTLHPTDHLMFLLCHAYKHFLHGGFGIRQVCDIGMFAQKYENEIDWAYIKKSCESIRIDRLTAAVFAILSKYLDIVVEQPFSLAIQEADEQPLLLDILSGGLYGVDDPNRAHSATITLNAVSSAKKGHSRRRLHLRRTLFPSRGSLMQRYPFLQKSLLLLPVAWLLRILGYVKKNLHMEGSVDARESLRIGAQRVDLLRMYGIVQDRTGD